MLLVRVDFIFIKTNEKESGVYDQFVQYVASMF